MNVREKLIEILRKPIFPRELADPIEAVADYLLDNGVTVQEWIPVTERLPDLIPCNVGTAYSEAVIAWTSGRKAMIAVWDGMRTLSSTTTSGSFSASRNASADRRFISCMVSFCMFVDGRKLK